jgi:tetratricopeptide (TPR) repeat protein
MMEAGTETGDTVASRRPTPIVRDAELLFRRGVDALERNRFDEAAGLLRQAVELAPESPAIHLALGIAATRLLDVPTALGALEKAIELEPHGLYAHFRLAELYMRIGVPTKAREGLQRAMDLSTDTDQRKMVRELLAADDKRASKRIWRPNFGSIVGRKPKLR